MGLNGESVRAESGEGELGEGELEEGTGDSSNAGLALHWWRGVSGSLHILEWGQTVWKCENVSKTFNNYINCGVIKQILVF